MTNLGRLHTFGVVPRIAYVSQWEDVAEIPVASPRQGRICGIYWTVLNPERAIDNVGFVFDTEKPKAPDVTYPDKTAILSMLRKEDELVAFMVEAYVAQGKTITSAPFRNVTAIDVWRKDGCCPAMMFTYADKSQLTLGRWDEARIAEDQVDRIFPWEGVPKHHTLDSYGESHRFHIGVLNARAAKIEINRAPFKVQSFGQYVSWGHSSFSK